MWCCCRVVVVVIVVLVTACVRVSWIRIALPKPIGNGNEQISIFGDGRQVSTDHICQCLDDLVWMFTDGMCRCIDFFEHV